MINEGLKNDRFKLTFKSEKPKISDLAGLGKVNNKTNSVDLKKSLYEK